MGTSSRVDTGRYHDGDGWLSGEEITADPQLLRAMQVLRAHFPGLQRVALVPTGRIGAYYRPQHRGA